MSPFFKIPKRNFHCAGDNKPLNQVGEFISSLIETDEEGVWLRQDYCLPCWEKAKQEDPEVLKRIHWRAKCQKVPPLVAQSELQILELVRELVNEKAAYTPEELFVIALYLERKKWISLQKEIIDEQGKTWMLYEFHKLGETLLLPKVIVTPLHIPAIEEKIATQLSAWERALKHRRAHEGKNPSLPR